MGTNGLNSEMHLCNLIPCRYMLEKLKKCLTIVGLHFNQVVDSLIDHRPFSSDVRWSPETTC